jgi:integrase
MVHSWSERRNWYPPSTELHCSGGWDRRPSLFGEGQGPFQGWSKARAGLDRRAAAAGHPLAPWRLHDLRRTVATRLAELGVQPHVIEAVLNHVSGHQAGVAGIYNRVLYAATDPRQPPLAASRASCLTFNPDEPEPPFLKPTHGLKSSDDGQGSSRGRARSG